MANIYRMEAYDSLMWGYFLIGIIDFMFKSKSLLQYSNLFSPNDHENNDKIKVKYFK